MVLNMHQLTEVYLLYSTHCYGCTLMHNYDNTKPLGGHPCMRIQLQFDAYAN